ncbi:MAG: hypothetical protein ACOC9B_02365 [Chloroflexota bacterium]
MSVEQGVFFAAFGGGVAAGIVILGIEMIRRYWERPLVRVTVSVALSMSEDSDARDVYLILEASNVHGQPVTLVSCGLVLSTGHRVLLPRSQMADFPIELGLQRPVVKTIPAEQLLGRLEVWGCVPDDVKYAYFVSATGSVFKTKVTTDVTTALSRGCTDLPSRESQRDTVAVEPVGEQTDTFGTQRGNQGLLSRSTFRRLTRR